MPELPEAETIARSLHDRLHGQWIESVVVLRRDVIHGDPRPLGRLLAGERIVRVHRRAKAVVLDISHGVRVMIRLGMSGRLTLESRDAGRLPHTHLIVRFSGVTDELRFRDPRRFGGVWCLTEQGAVAGRAFREPGPEPLTLRAAAFRRILHRNRPIKSLLLDQQRIAGIGNIYCDEALFRAGVHPARSAHSLDHAESARLLASIKRVLRTAIRHRGSTLMDYRTPEGEAGSFREHHLVYQREGQACRTCGTTIIRMQLAQRSTFVCPVCQPPG